VRGVQFLLREFPDADACAEKIPNFEDHHRMWVIENVRGVRLYRSATIIWQHPEDILIGKLILLLSR
jgi:hypothetical protein